ncbi:helix-turn-helix domain-containing protein [Halosegnis sp.]|uniref:helix-turn-helix domain-containing protein n=1 Tax=Halosegnis sp. TaxID=2864959 RepID=UPI0035D5048A
MARARLQVTPPPDFWVGRLTRDESARLRIRSATLGDPAALVVDLMAPDMLPTATAALADAPDVVGLDILDREADRALCRVQTTTTEPLSAAAAAGTPPAFPFVVADGVAQWTVLAPNEALSALADRLDTAGLAFEVQEVTASVEPSRPLTPRQRRVARAAVDCGYYETPRDCSLTDLADALGLAKSTVSETLRRAEGQLLADHLASGGDQP